MTYDTARTRIILFSLAVTGSLLPFLFIGPAVGYPLQPPQARQLIAVIIPVFLSYLGAGIAYVFKGTPAEPEPNPERRSLLGLLINGAFLVFTLCLLSLIGAFGYSNRLSALPGTGMEFTEFAAGMTAILGILTSTVGASMVYLFGQAAAAPAAGPASSRPGGGA